MNQIQIINKFISYANVEINETAREVLSKLEITDKIIEIEAVDKTKIAELNSKYRGKDEITNVLSFPLSQTPNESNLLGNIFICEEVAEEKEEDLLELVKHGILHLIGFDHEIDQDKWDEQAQEINHKM